MPLLSPYTIVVTQTIGRCRWCGCSYMEPCAGGCGWANRDNTLCSACVPLDAAVKTRAGRRELAEFLQENQFLPPVKAKAADRCSRPFCNEPRLSPRHKLCRFHSEAR